MAVHAPHSADSVPSVPPCQHSWAGSLGPLCCWFLALSYTMLSVGFYWVDYQHPSSGSICQAWLYYLSPLVLYLEFQVFSDF